MDYCYIAYRKDLDLHKIGCSCNPRRRSREFMGNAQLVMALGNHECAGSLEKTLHKHFHAKRVIGEWFRLTASQAKMLCVAFAYCECHLPKSKGWEFRGDIALINRYYPVTR